jgi:O-antigen/teichoic acid export membrane protein
MFATPMYLISAFYMDQLLWLLTGEAEGHPQTYWTGQVLLFWGYTTILTQSVSKRIFMMTGHERRLMWLGVGEALLNLGLSVALIYQFKNVVCVAVGSLTATFIFGWFYLWPWAAREANLSGWHLARTVIFPTWLACLPLVVLIVVGRQFTPPEFQTSVYAIVTEGAMVFTLAAVCMWKFALSHVEREKCSAVFLKLFSRGTPA